MKLLKFLAAAIAAMTICASAPAPAVAQTATRNSLDTLNNSYFRGCGTGCITGPITNAFNSAIVANLPVLNDTNYFLGTNSFAGPTIFPGFTGCLYANDKGPMTVAGCSFSAIPGPSLVGNASNTTGGAVPIPTGSGVLPALGVNI